MLTWILKSRLVGRGGRPTRVMLPAYLSIVFQISGLVVFAQATRPEAKVRKVVGETEDSVMFQASVSKGTFSRGDNIPIDFLVTNKSRRTVYLVTEPRARAQVTDDLILRLLEPVVGPDDHKPFDYDLIGIPPQKTFKGRLLLDAKYYLLNKSYDFEVAEIQVGFSYLFDKSQLVGCKRSRLTLPCLKELYDKSKSLTVGNLLIEIKKR